MPRRRFTEEQIGFALRLAYSSPNAPKLTRTPLLAYPLATTILRLREPRPLQGLRVSQA